MPSGQVSLGIIERRRRLRHARSICNLQAAAAPRSRMRPSRGGAARSAIGSGQRARSMDRTRQRVRQPHGNTRCARSSFIHSHAPAATEIVNVALVAPCSRARRRFNAVPKLIGTPRRMQRLRIGLFAREPAGSSWCATRPGRANAASIMQAGAKLAVRRPRSSTTTTRLLYGRCAIIRSGVLDRVAMKRRRRHHTARHVPSFRPQRWQFAPRRSLDVKTVAIVAGRQIRLLDRLFRATSSASSIITAVPALRARPPRQPCRCEQHCPVI